MYNAYEIHWKALYYDTSDDDLNLITAAGWLGGVNELDEAIDYMELKAKHNGQWVAFSSDGKTKPSSIDEIVCTVRQHGKIISRYWNGTAWEWQRV